MSDGVNRQPCNYFFNQPLTDQHNNQMNNNESTKKYLEKLKEQASLKPVEEKKNKSVHGLLNLLDAPKHVNHDPRYKP